MYIASKAILLLESELKTDKDLKFYSCLPFINLTVLWRL